MGTPLEEAGNSNASKTPHDTELKQLRKRIAPRL
jgi:hypothetical protein